MDFEKFGFRKYLVELDENITLCKQMLCVMNSGFKIKFLQLGQCTFSM